MPNQRNSKKKQLRTWMHIRDVKLLRALAKREHLELGDFLAQIAAERASELNQTKND